MHFTQAETETRLANTVPNGIKRDVARHTGLYEAIVYAWFNPHDERKSPMFKTLQIQAALDEINPEAGEAHWQEMKHMREANRSVESELCVKAEAARFMQEAADVANKTITDAPLLDQLSEALEARDQAERHVQAVLGAINKEKTAGGQTRIPPRQFAQQVIRQKNGRRA